MSGYRSLHREQVQSENIPIWQVNSSSPLVSVSNASSSAGAYLIWTASADGYVRAYRVQEKDAASEENALNASALTLVNTHIFAGTNQPFPPSADSIKSAIGCTQVSIVRNYVGEDDMAGDHVVASLDMVGRVRVWTCTQQELAGIAIEGDDDSAPTKVVATHEFQIENATGTILSLCPPNIAGHGDVIAAVACMDGSVAMVATGISTPATTGKQKDPSAAGTILDKWGSGAIVLSLAWHPTKHCIVVGRKDGVVDVIPSTKQGTHRILHHAHPVRAVAFTPDSQLLVTGCDSGLLCVWDVNRRVPTMVHHVVDAHASWILGVAVLADSRRFITLGVDQKLHVWSVGQIYAPMHTFHCDHTMWTIHTTKAQEPRQQQRLVCGSDKGFIQLYSLESA